MPVLIAIAGPVQGRTFVLPEGEWSVGRSSRSQLWLDDPEVSRRHCIFVTSGETCEVRDLGSRNGVLVNGQAATAAALAGDDEIAIGSAVFLYSVETPSTADRLEGNTRVTQLRPEESAYLSGNRGAPLSERSARDFKTLLRLANLLHSMRQLERGGASPRDVLLEKLGCALLDLIPADRGGVVPPDRGDEMVQRACEERTALWSRDMAEGSTRLVSPILVRDGAPAALVLESDKQGQLGEDDLQLLTAIAEIAAVAWENASILSWLQEQNRQLEGSLGLEHAMVGEAPALRELQRRIAKAAPADATVLIVGESGSGKELVARALHRNSPRANGPFFAINCAAFPETLLESELFGHEKGAFTGATEARRGKLEAAEGGVLFFDEIGELALPLQAKLLRVIETREMHRVGGTQTIRLNIRIVAATNRNLEEAVRKGGFRQDLYFRLKVVTLRTPALREHPQDIAELAEHFVHKAARACGRRILGMTPEALSCLRNYSWPGNVRELANAMESAVVLGNAETIGPEDLPEYILQASDPASQTGSYTAAIEAARRDAILKAFEQASYDHDAAAHTLGVHPNYLHKLLRTMDLKTELRKRANR